MGLTRLRSFLRRHPRIALDTSVFIYQLEANPLYVALTDSIFMWVEQPDHAAVTSTITMLELLVQPYRDRSEQRVNEYYGLLSTYPNLRWIAPDLEVADMASRIRAAHRLRTPDALQAACATRAQATGLITNDPVFERVEAFETLVLDKLLPPPKAAAPA
ncbi:MAG TPA: PIN domain-containing protein [Bryobacteraceae bacterium]|nr:PIN domain-containing protein [Bryobacteraceae bacterium]